MKRNTARLWYGLSLLGATWVGYWAGQTNQHQPEIQNKNHHPLSIMTTPTWSPPRSLIELEESRVFTEIFEEKEEEADAEDGALDPLEFLTVICIVLVLIALTLAFEFLKEYLEESVEEEFEIILEKFFGELTVLGFLAMVTFIFAKTGLAAYLSERIFDEEQELLEYFESVHFAVFFIMVFFVIQVLLMIRAAERQQHKWSAIDDRIRSKGEPRDALTETELQTLYQMQHQSRLALIYHRCFRDKSKTIQQQDEIMFRALRREFILDRSLEVPFPPIDEEKRVQSTFSFGRYLGLAQIHVLSHAIEVEHETWCFFAIMAIAYYLIGSGVHYQVDVLEWVWVLFGWIVYVTDLAFAGHIMKLLLMFLPKENDGSHLNEQAELSTNLAGITTESLEDLPAWCFVNHHKALEERPWLVKFLVGGVPNRQQIHFWMDRHGPHFYTTLLQMEAVFTGVYAGLLLLEFFPYVVRTHWYGTAILYMILAVVPLVGVIYNKRGVVPVMAQVSSIGTYRKDQIVRDVLLEDKTSRIVRTFLVIQHIRHVAEHGIPSAEEESEHGQTAAPGHPHQFSAREEREIGRTFDALDEDSSGSISKAEFRELLTRLGVRMDEHKFDRIVACIDKDGDGEVDRAEFIAWYKYNSRKDTASPAEQAQELFQILDDNDSGDITLGEFKSKLDSLNMGFTIDEIGAILNELDKDNTGSIDAHEFEQFVVKYYPKELSASRNQSNGYPRHSSQHSSHHH